MLVIILGLILVGPTQEFTAKIEVAESKLFTAEGENLEESDIVGHILDNQQTVIIYSEFESYGYSHCCFGWQSDNNSLPMSTGPPPPK